MLRLLILGVIITLAASYPGNSRIVDGEDAKIGELPYIVSLRNQNSHKCGGSIVDNWHVLTAAHCIHQKNVADLSIQYGITDLTSNENIIQVDKVYEHEKFNPDNYNENDIAILKLKYYIPLSPIARIVILPTQGKEPPVDNWATLSGWGALMVGGSAQTNLQKVKILVYSDENCAAAHGNKVNSKYHLCAGVPEGGKGQCSGDSGGPLIANGEQIGVVSWSIKPPCTAKGFPGVFTRVANYIDWIHQVLLTS